MSIKRFNKMVIILRAMGWEYRGSAKGNFTFSHRETLANGLNSLLKHGCLNSVSLG
jgi:hypothetical protein